MTGMKNNCNIPRNYSADGILTT